MDSQLQTTLQKQIQSGWQSNPATHQIITSYARYHAVVAIAGSLFAVTLLWLTLRFWLGFRKIPKIRRLKWTFEKKVYFCFASVFTLVVIFLGLIVVGANISTAVKPLPGFSESIPSLTDNSYNVQLHKAFKEWIVSGKTRPPSLVQQRIHHRRVFHTTRVVVGAALLVVFTMLSARFWKALIAQRNSSKIRWTIKEVAWLLAGILSVGAALLMMIVVLANLQSAIVPIANTLQFG